MKQLYDFQPSEHSEDDQYLLFDVETHAKAASHEELLAHRARRIETEPETQDNLVPRQLGALALPTSIIAEPQDDPEGRRRRRLKRQTQSQLQSKASQPSLPRRRTRRPRFI